MGKKRRDQYIKNNNISYYSFLPSWLYSNKIILSDEGFRGIPRKNSSDFYSLFGVREEEIKSHLTMNKN